MKDGRRLTLLHPNGHEGWHLTLTEPPFPEVGDTLRHGGLDWQVLGIKPVEIITKSAITVIPRGKDQL